MTTTDRPTHGRTPRDRHARLTREDRARQARIIESLADGLGFTAPTGRLDYFSISPGIGYRG